MEPDRVHQFGGGGLRRVEDAEPGSAAGPGAKYRRLFAPARLAPTETAEEASIFAAKPASSKLAFAGEEFYDPRDPSIFRAAGQVCSRFSGNLTMT
jgi:hypothetical protein